jgi:hypothetical protein
MYAATDPHGPIPLPKRDEPTILTAQQVAAIVYEMLMMREGLPITASLAHERAANIATALLDTRVLP